MAMEADMKRNIHLKRRCFLCGEEVETVTHLFLHGRVTTFCGILCLGELPRL